MRTGLDLDAWLAFARWRSPANKARLQQSNWVGVLRAAQLIDAVIDGGTRQELIGAALQSMIEASDLPAEWRTAAAEIADGLNPNHRSFEPEVLEAAVKMCELGSRSCCSRTGRLRVTDFCRRRQLVAKRQPNSRSSTGGMIRQTLYGVYGRRADTAADGRRRSLYAKTRREAQERLRAALTASDHAILPVDGRLTVGVWLDQWLDTSIRARCRPSTAENYAAVARLFLRPAIGRVPLAN